MTKKDFRHGLFGRILLLKLGGSQIQKKEATMKLRTIALPVALLLLGVQCEELRDEPCVPEQVVVNGECYNVCGRYNYGPCNFLER